jgi:HrpA-like RNA helicase
MIISDYCPLFTNILWGFQESNDGQSMMEFRRSLPANKERQSLLEAISQNQVLLLF